MGSSGRGMAMGSREAKGTAVKPVTAMSHWGPLGPWAAHTQSSPITVREPGRYTAAPICRWSQAAPGGVHPWCFAAHAGSGTLASGAGAVHGSGQRRRQPGLHPVQAFRLAFSEPVCFAELFVHRSCLPGCVQKP